MYTDEETQLRYLFSEGGGGVKGVHPGRVLASFAESPGYRHHDRLGYYK